MQKDYGKIGAYIITTIYVVWLLYVMISTRCLITGVI